MLTLKLAVRLAFAGDRRQRWRQVSVVVAAFIGTLAVLAAAGVIAATANADEHWMARTPRLADDSAASMLWTDRIASLNRQQFPIEWLQPIAPNAPVPPGLKHLPEPGSVVLSPGLVAAGITASDFGLTLSRAGTGTDGVIGDEGLRASSEPMAYARPATGRSIDSDTAQRISGFGSTLEAADALEPFRPLPTLHEALVAVSWSLIAPAGFLIGGAARASSGLRAQRARGLYILGLRPRRVQALLAAETAALATAGALLAALVWLVVGGRVSSLPMTGTRVLPGTMGLPLGLTIALALLVAAVMAAISMAMPFIPRDSPRRRWEPAAWMLAPYVASLTMMAVSATLSFRSPVRVPLLFGGMLLALAAIPLALPVLARWAASWLSRSREGTRWWAGRRLHRRAGAFSRPAASVAALIFIAGAAVAMLDRMQDHEVPVNVTAPQGYVVGWGSVRPGDAVRVAERMRPAVTLIEAPGGLIVTSCEEASRALHLMRQNAGACDDPAQIPPLLSRLGAAMGAPVTVDQRPDPGASSVVVLGDQQGDVLSAMRDLGGIVPAPNVTMIQSNERSSGVTGGWLLASWALACGLLTLALVREVCERIVQSLTEDRTPGRLGVGDRELMRVHRWSLLPPVMLAIPLGMLSAIAFALIGAQLGVTAANVGRVAGVGILAAALSSAGIALVFAMHRRRAMSV